jgi:Tat protein translocase TatB subunit
MPDFGELLIIAIVALVVIPPQRLPQAARTLGQWMGKMQSYVAQMRVDFDREFHLADLRSVPAPAPWKPPCAAPSPACRPMSAPPRRMQ